MAKREIPDAAVLRNRLAYDPETGKITWRTKDVDPANPGETKRWNKRHAGTFAGTVSGEGYLCVGVCGTVFPAHRLIWTMVHGTPPQGEIDHINHDRLDNRLANLRDVPKAENILNQSLRRNNKSGVTGVDWDKRERKWRAQFSLNGKRVRLGAFADKDEAIKVRRAAEAAHGYHKNHGRA
jgi:hypothetical protein